MASNLLFVIFFVLHDSVCSSPGQDNRIISKVLYDKRFSAVNTTTYNPQKCYSNCPNNYEDFSDESSYVTNSTEEEDPEGPLDHQIPYSEHEVPKNLSTHPNYTAPGVWSKPPPGKNISLDFVPTKLYAQVRASHTIKRVPQEEAIETAETKEEKENAARLREVVTNSKIATVYTEEGFEDSAYDHAGHTRGANFHQGYARNLHDELNRETQEKGKGNGYLKARPTSPETKYADDYFQDYREHFDDSISIEEIESRSEGKLANVSGASKLNKNVASIFKEELKNPKFNPKLVVEEGIDKLENQNKYENEEVKRGSEMYGAEKLTKSREDYDYDEFNSSEHPKLENSRTLEYAQFSNISDDSNDNTRKQFQLKKKTEPVYTIRPGNKFDIYMRKIKKNINASRKSEGHDKKSKKSLKNHQNIPRVTERYEETTSLKPVFSVNNPTEDNKVSRLGYMSDVPTTINYGEMFWNYFKERQNQRAALKHKIFREETTDSIMTSIINEHGPCLLVTKKQKNVVTPHPLINLIASKLISNLANDPVPESTRLQRQNQAVQRTEYNEILDGIVSNTVNPEIADPTVKSLILGNNDYNSEVFLNTLKPSRQNKALEYSTTPEYSVSATNFPTRQKTSHYDHNPFLIHYARSANSNIPHYTVLIRAHSEHTRKGNPIFDANLPQTNVKRTLNNQQKPVTQSILNQEKMLYHLETQENFRPIVDSLNTRSNQEFSFLEPPPPPPPPPPSSLSSREVTYSDFLPHSYAQKRSEWPDNQVGNPVRESRAKFLNDLEYTISKKFSAIPHRKESILMLYLHPPDPLNRSEYDEYHIRTRRSEKRLKSKETKKEISSLYPTIANLMQIMKPSFLNVRKHISMVKKRIKRNIMNVKKYEINIVRPEVESLDETPQIVDKVINNETKKRFENTGDHNNTNEKSLNNEVETEIPDFKYVNEIKNNNFLRISTLRSIIDSEKYPFYENDTIESSLTLKYIINPERVPRKTLGGMEFYESRNYFGCDEVNPNLENVVPPEEEPVENRSLQTDLPRLQGLGERLDCFKAKYFDDNPLDNPLFLESQVEQPMLPVELNKTKFAARILGLPSNNDDYLSLKLSKDSGKIRLETATGELGNITENTKISRIRNNKSLSSRIKTRPSIMHNRRSTFYTTTPYQTDVNEDVMDNIQNVERIYDTGMHKSFSPITFKTTLLPVTKPSRVISTTKIALMKLLYPMKHSNHLMNDATNSLRQTETGTDKAFNYPFLIEGLLPPLQRIRIIRNTPYKIANMMKIRNYPKTGGKMFLGYYSTLQLKKRNKRRIYFPRINIRKIFKRCIADSSLKFPSDSNKLFNNTIQRKTKSSILKSSSRDDIPFNETKKIVYTINDRIRYSKHKEKFGKHGLFTTEPTQSEIDSRREEPRYNPIIKRRKASSTFHTSTKLPVAKPTDEFEISKTVVPTSPSNLAIIVLEKEVNQQTPLTKEFVSEQKNEVTFKLDIPVERKTRVHIDPTETSVEEQKKFENASRYNDETRHKYDVYEEVSEEKPYVEPNRYKGSSELEEHTEKVDEMDEGGNYGEDGSSENSEEYAEEVLEPQDEKEHADQPLKKSKEINEDDRTFERFDSRPFSPPENFEDEKYVDLGPRVHKPAFYHPPFVVPRYERSHLGRIIDRFDSDHSREIGDTEKYVFPWEEEENEENGEETRHFNSFMSVSDKVQKSISIPFPQGITSTTVNFLQAQKGSKMILTATPRPLSASSRSMTSLDILPELVRNKPKRKQKNRTARTNLKNTITNSAPRSKKKLRLNQNNVASIKTSNSSAMDPASRVIRKRSSTKSNSRISKTDRFISQQANTTERINCRRGSLGSSTILPENSVIASTRQRISMEDDLDFDNSTPISRTIEDHSRVSKEGIIIKTVYASENMFLNKNQSISDNRDEVGAEDPNHDNNKTTSENIYEPQLMILESESKGNSNVNRLLLEDVETDIDNEAAKLGTALTSDNYVLENLMNNVPLQHRNRSGSSEEGRKSYDPDF